MPAAAGAAPAPPVPVLTGPTGTGKSDWALRLAGELPVEIVTVDSAQIYRGMDIGTAKPSREARARVPHHLLDIRDPAESYSAGEFVADATAAIESIRARGRIPLLVGGTMLYLRALGAGLASLPRGSAQLRGALDERAVREGWPALHAELARLDPQAAARIHPNDPQRIQRALEVYYATGRPLSELQQAGTLMLPALALLRWALVPADRSVLHQRIAERFRAMMARGFLEEVANLHARADLTARHPAIRAVGYRQLWAHLDGRCSLEHAVEQGIAATRQLAKRQLTWIRSDAAIRRIDPLAARAYERWREELQRELGRLGC